MKKRILLVCALTAGVASFNAQRWEPASQRTSQIRKEVDVKYSYRVDLASLRSILKDAVETGKGAKAVIVSLPTAEGKIEKFAVYSNPVMEKSMADRYQLGSYVGVGVEDPSKYVRFSTSPTEMQSMIIKDGVFQFIEPITTDKQTYGVFYKTKRTNSEQGFECGTNETNIKDIQLLRENGKKKLSNVGITNRPASTKYRTYRLAMSTTSEYTAYFGGVAGAVTQINNTMTRVNGVFEKDFGIKLLLQNYPNIIYTNAATDPYSDSDAGVDDALWNGELMNVLHNNVGEANFDIGHLFGATGGGGNAGCIGCICSDDMTLDQGSPVAYKGSGFTSPANGVPSGDSFDIDYVAHELGHQLGGNHTFSNNTEGSGVNVEPGGGTTIMGYAGITYDNVQMVSDAYFHYSSVNQILNNLDDKTTCGVSQTITTNTAPVISPLTAYSIPKGTAYYLEATATDTDPVKYTWEQYDSVDEDATISGDSGWGYNSQGAVARSFFGTASGRRYFPSLPLVMSGKLTNKATWESVSYVPRQLHYAVTVRDENAQRPMLSSSETTVTVGNDGPFKFDGLTASSVLYNNASNTIKWAVANTTAAPYNVANVKIDYTADNGVTWTELVASTPNTGSYAVQMPGSLTGAVKLRVSAINNVFYAVSPAVTIGTAPTSTTAAPTGLSTTSADVLKNSAIVSWNSVPGAATYSVNYRKLGVSAWTNASSTTNSLLLSTLEDEATYEVQVAAVVNSIPGSFSSNYVFKTKPLATGVNYCILNTGYNSVGNIARVQLSNINHIDTTIRSYKDLSEDPAKIINLIRGNSYPISIFGIYNQAAPMTYNVWIDYNRNGVYEASEKVYTSAATAPAANGIGSVTGNFTVPATALVGNKVVGMRVASNYSAALSSACGTLPSGAGSVMDFSVRIFGSALAVDETKETKTEVEIYPNPADTFVGVRNLKGKADYKIYSADGRLVQSGNIDNQIINVAGLTKGMYIITIKDDKNTYNTKLIKK
ncbi:T9SS type A sorting domain-containing protein [Chryseobacterium sp. RP-3-3]|uniref:T9SS type A sorting domain-containing protein n=1 Tax=Chryseobacterium antibioticum TaxID=2728847 RepID=A0A7Y0ARG7_9FLAO|nr:M12 family metallo-peptidase [Chryseobacterium antibioticum]NML72159.1 T9SS type A sorting domain-containing protein [Chryseobacterium antibioticum]